MQYEKHSDKLTRQLVSANVIDEYKKIGVIVRTEVPEVRRPWFADAHDQIEKPLFIAVSGSGIVFLMKENNAWCVIRIYLCLKRYNSMDQLLLQRPKS